MIYTGAAELAYVDEEVTVVAAEDRARIGADDGVSFRDGGMARAVEQRIKLQSPVRKIVSPWWSAALLRFLEDAPDDLIVGKDGFLFLRTRVQMKESVIRDGPVVLANYLYALRRRAAIRGIRLVSLPVPRKSVVLQDKLPAGVDSSPDVEQRLHAALAARGNEFVNSLEAWKDTDPVKLYDSKDSHWAISAQVALGKALVRQSPELKRDDHESRYATQPANSSMELLRFAGVVSGHPSRGLFPTEGHGRVIVEDRSVAKRLADKGFAGDIVLSGTSFSQSSSLHAILTILTQSDLEMRARNGAATTETLSELLADRVKSGVYPSVVLDEFPVSHIDQVMSGTRKTVQAFGDNFALLDVADVTPIVDALVPTHTATLLGDKRHLFPERSLISSGDGALAIEIVAESAHSSRWTLKSGGTRFAVQLSGLGARVVIPVVEGPEWSGRAVFYPAAGSDSKARVRVRTVIEGAPVVESGEGLLLTAGGDGFTLEESHAIDAGDTFLFQWAKPCKELSIELQGLDSMGTPIRDVYTFTNPRGTSAAIAPRRIGGGTLTRVRVTGPDVSVTLSRARVPRP